MNWLFEHVEDNDLNDPLPTTTTTTTGGSSGGGGGGSNGPPAEAIAQLTSLGFTEEQVLAALKSTQNNVERAADWLFSHMDDLAAAVASVNSSSSSSGGGGGGGSSNGAEFSDGEGRYDLVGFISHVGRNTTCGHYVAHIKKEGRWAIFDDEKVAVSEHPPRDLGYLYLFSRSDAMNVS